MRSVFQAKTDRDLLNRFRRSRDCEAFGELVHRYGPVVFAICRRVLRDDSSAEDAFQQTFMNLARFAQDIQKPGALPGWLHATARRAALRIARQHTDASLPNEIETRTRDPMEEISARELISAIEEELAALPQEYRSAILLCGIEGLTVNEAAQRLGTTNGSMRGWLQRGRELLKKQMSQRGLVLPAALGALFGIPTTVSAAMTNATIDAAVALPTVKPALLAKLLSSGAMKVLACLLVIAVAAFTAWKSPETPPLPNTNPKPPPLPPLQIAKWELTTNTPLPKGAVARIGDGRHTLALGTKQIRFVEGRDKLVAVGKTDLLAWNVATGDQLHRTVIEDAAGDVSPDGKWFVQLGHVYESLTGRRVWKAFEDRRPDEVRFVAPNRVGLTFAGGETPRVMIRLLDVVAKEVAEGTFPGAFARPLPGGDLVAVWDQHDKGGIRPDDERQGEIRIHSFTNPKGQPIVLDGYKGLPLSVETDAAGLRLFAATSDGQLLCWNTATGRQLYKAKVDLPATDSTSRQPDGKDISYISKWNVQPLSVSPRGDKVVWRSWVRSSPHRYICHSVESQKLLWSVPPPRGRDTRSSFLFDETNDRLIVDNQGIEIRSLQTGELLSPVDSEYALRGPKDDSQAMALSGDGRLVAFSSNNIGLFDVAKLLDPKATSTDTPETRWREEQLYQFGFVPGSSRLVWSASSRLTIHDIDERKVLDSVNIPGRIVQDRFAGPKWVSFDRWNLKWTDYSWDGSRLRKSERPASALLKNDQRNEDLRGIVYPHADCVYTSEIEAGKQPRAFVTCWEAFTGRKRWVYCIQPDPNFTPTSWTKFGDGIEVYHQYQPIKFIALPDGKRILVLTSTRLFLLDCDSGQELKSISSENTKERRVEFDNLEISSDGTLLAMGIWFANDWKGELRFRRAEDLMPTGKPMDLGKLHSYGSDLPNIHIAMNQDASLIATVSNTDNGVEVFDVASGKRKYRLPEVRNCHRLALSADGRRLLAKEPNHSTALVWDLTAFAEK